MRFSVIVPVYNRPLEVKELLESLTRQRTTPFEVLIIEDGSDQRCEEIVNSFQDKLKIRYINKSNSGQGFSRNLGFKEAHGEYLVVFDSDCLVPPHYFETVERALDAEPFDAWGGPDRSHPSFSPLQRAISYSMTSPLTTGGLRGARHMADTWHPRSFNMGVHRRVVEATGGYERTRKGEDLDFSMRIRAAGFQVRYLEDAWVYHKRRDRFGSFFRQLHFFGEARISLSRKHPGTLRPIHLLPALFLIYLVAAPVISLITETVWPLVPFLLWSFTLLVDARLRNETWSVSFLAILTSTIQLAGYGAGLLREWIHGEKSPAR